MPKMMILTNNKENYEKLNRVYGKDNSKICILVDVNTIDVSSNGNAVSYNFSQKYPYLDFSKFSIHNNIEDNNAKILKSNSLVQSIYGIFEDDLKGSISFYALLESLGFVVDDNIKVIDDLDAFIDNDTSKPKNCCPLIFKLGYDASMAQYS
jgi:hypothetical protein